MWYWGSNLGQSMDFNSLNHPLGLNNIYFNILVLLSLFKKTVIILFISCFLLLPNRGLALNTIYILNTEEMELSLGHAGMY